MMDLLRQKKFRAALIGLIVALVAKLGIELDTQDVFAIVSPILAYIVGQGVADHGKSRAQEIVKALSVDAARDISIDSANEELLP